ncbi:MAG: 3'-5' exonuclease, partial [bacterium]
AGSVTLALVEKNLSSAHDEENSESEAEDPGPYYRESELVAEQIARALSGDDPDYKRVRAARDKGQPAVALLFRRRTEMQWYITALRRHAIPFSVVKGRGFYGCQEIWDLLNALEFLSDPRQDIALVGLLRSPLLGLSDDTIYLASRAKGRTFFDKLRRLLREQETLLFRAIPPRDAPLAKRAAELLESWLFKKSRLPVALLLRTIIEDSGYQLTLSLGLDGRQKIANVEKLLEQARNFDLGRVRGPSEFVTQLQGLVSAEEAEGEADIDLEQAAPVLLMTIHAAKGLQFPMVVLPDLGSRLNKTTGYFKLRFDEFYLPNAAGTNFEPIFLAGLQVPRGPDPPAKSGLTVWLTRQALQKTFAEYRRLLYVGATRAEDHLVLAGQLERDEHGNIKLPPSETTPRSLMDWVARHLDLREWPDSDVISFAGAADEPPTQVHLRCWDPNRPLPTVAEPPQFDEGILADEIRKRREDALTRNTVALDPLEAQRVHRLSPTSLMTYNRCPRQFFYRNILRLSPAAFRGWGPAGDAEEESIAAGQAINTVEREDDAIISSQEKALLLGLLVHRAIELGETDLNWFRSETPRLRAAHGDGEIAPLLSDQVAKIAATACEHAQRFQKTPRGKKLLVLAKEENKPHLLKEAPFRHRLGKVEFTGQLDCLYFDAEEREWIVVDYKTNPVRGG